MEIPSVPRARRPSPWWIAAASLGIACALTSVGWAVIHQRAADRPVGEGELFLDEAQQAVDLVTSLPMGDGLLDDTVRRVRNDLGIEGFAVVGTEGTIAAATSDNLVGTPITNPMLAFALGQGRFGAVAMAIDAPLLLDGVEEWSTGDVLYQVLAPIDEEEGAALLYYDVAELLERRARASGIQPLTLELMTVAAVFAGGSLLALIGRSRAVRRYREIEIESEFLRRHSSELQAHNQELDEARRQAERALSLAEEKNRIRSEFVLMINHELRTPLTSLVSGAELMRSGELSPAATRSILDDMISDGRRLESMISQILDVARIENRGLSYELQAVHVDDVSRHITTAAGTQVELVGPARVDALRTDPQTLARLVRLLVDNARVHGASNVTVGISDTLGFQPMHEVGSRPPGAVYVIVADDGPGIRPSFLPRAFEKFEKDSFSAGTGLGLYVARLMAEAIEASLVVHSSPGGTRLAVALPGAVTSTGEGVAA